MSPPKLTLTDAPAPAIRTALVDPLARFNDAQAGPQHGYRPLVITVSDPDTEAIVGGLWGNTAYSHLQIELLFLPDSLRGAGLGRRLMLDAETEAMRRGCRGAWPSGPRESPPTCLMVAPWSRPRPWRRMKARARQSSTTGPGSG